jgi:hypothetical protein
MKNPLEYLNGLLGVLFKSGDAGKKIYYPWLLFKEGYVLDKAEQEAQIKSFLKLFYSILLGGAAALAILFMKSWLIFLFLIIMGGWYYYQNAQFTERLHTSKIRLNLQDVYKIVVRSYDLKVLWIFFGISAFFVLLGLYLLFQDAFLTKALGLLVIAAFGVKLVFFEEVIRFKRGGSPVGSISSFVQPKPIDKPKGVLKMVKATSKGTKKAATKTAKKTVKKTTKPAAKKTTAKKKTTKSTAKKK